MKKLWLTKPQLKLQNYNLHVSYKDLSAQR